MLSGISSTSFSWIEALEILDCLDCLDCLEDCLDCLEGVVMSELTDGVVDPPLVPWWRARERRVEPTSLPTREWGDAYSSM